MQLQFVEWGRADAPSFPMATQWLRIVPENEAGLRVLVSKGRIVKILGPASGASLRHAKSGGHSVAVVRVAVRNVAPWRLRVTAGMPGADSLASATVVITAETVNQPRPVSLKLAGYASSPPAARKAILCELIARNVIGPSAEAFTTERWPDLPVSVHVADAAARQSVLAWQNALGLGQIFKFSPTPVSSGINIVEGDAVDARGRAGCGNVDGFETFEKMTIHLAPAKFMNCPSRGAVVLHEFGHALGYAEHTEGRGGVMDLQDSSWRNASSVDPETAAVMKLIYSNPDGTPLRKLGCPGF